MSSTDDRAPFRAERTGNFPVAANETAADMLCCALYPRIQSFPSTALHLHGRASSQEMSTRSRYERTCGGTIDSFWGGQSAPDVVISPSAQARSVDERWPRILWRSGP